MLSSKPLFNTIIEHFTPRFNFKEAEDFRWSPQDKTIYFNQADTHALERLLHEVAHAELGHLAYDRDIELIAIERDAWQHAKTTLAPLFETTIDSDVIEDDLDTYRQWLHARSTCPHCSSTGLQTDTQEYTCVSCRARWRVNQAIGCGLKRYIKNTSS